MSTLLIFASAYIGMAIPVAILATRAPKQGVYLSQKRLTFFSLVLVSLGWIAIVIHAFFV